MKENILSARELAQIKRIAQNVDADYQKVCKLNDKIAALTKERDDIQLGIDEMEAPVLRKTGGYKSTDIYEKVVTPVFNENGTPKTDKDGRQLKTTKYVLRYSESILPTPELPTPENESKVSGGILHEGIDSTEDMETISNPVGEFNPTF